MTQSLKDGDPHQRPTYTYFFAVPAIAKVSSAIDMRVLFCCSRRAASPAPPSPRHGKVDTPGILKLNISRRPNMLRRERASARPGFEQGRLTEAEKVLISGLAAAELGLYTWLKSAPALSDVHVWSHL
jgi:hypothetical protein